MISFSLIVLFASCAPEPEVVDTTIEDTKHDSVEASQNHTDENEDASLSVEGQTVASQFTLKQEELVGVYEGLNSKCRDTYSVDTDNNCAKRDQFYQKMRPANLCRGKKSDEAEYQMEWHVCNKDSLNFKNLDQAEKQGRCRLKLEDEIMARGKCYFKINNGGGFWIKTLDDKIFALVDRSDVNATAFVSIAGRPIMNDGDLGVVERDGACWYNANVEICAWE